MKTINSNEIINLFALADNADLKLNIMEELFELKEILKLSEMLTIKGGDNEGEDDGGIIPPPPNP